MRKVVFVFFIIFLILPVASGKAFAQYQEVLGVSTDISAQIPATPDGPGIILPDSPLFFLDKLKQQLRLMFALTPEAKATVYNSVAGERLAELRIMLDRKNRDGIAIDLRDISDNISHAAASLHDAKLLGKDTKALSEKLNTSIKEKLATLDILKSQVQGELEAETKATEESLLASKIQVENVLPQQDLENEIADDMNRKINSQVADASESVGLIAREIAILNQQASQAAQESQTRKEALIQHMIVEKNTALQSQTQKLLLSELQKQDQLFQLQGQASTQAQKAAEDAKLAIQKYQEAEDALQYLQSHPVPAPVAGQPSVAGSETSKK